MGLELTLQKENNYYLCNGKEYLRYEVKSLSNNIAELSMTVDGSGETLEVKAKKK